MPGLMGEFSDNVLHEYIDSINIDDLHTCEDCIRYSLGQIKESETKEARFIAAITGVGLFPDASDFGLKPMC